MKAASILTVVILAQCTGSAGFADESESILRNKSPFKTVPAKPLTDFRCSPNNPAWLCKLNPQTQCVEIYCTSGEHKDNPELVEIVCNRET